MPFALHLLLALSLHAGAANGDVVRADGWLAEQSSIAEHATTYEGIDVAEEGEDSDDDERHHALGANTAAVEPAACASKASLFAAVRSRSNAVAVHAPRGPPLA